MTQYDRKAAWELLTEYVQSDSQRKHALAVEATMRHFASLYGEDQEKWGIIGLIHDVDFERYPEEHCVKARDIMASHGWPEDYIHAVQSHGYGICCDVEPVEQMEKVLFTIDELTGLITATALMRPSRSLLDLEVSSVKKKWKTKGFAMGVNREVIESGTAMMGMSLDDVIKESIEGMKKIADELGLKGNLEA